MYRKRCKWICRRSNMLNLCLLILLANLNSANAQTPVSGNQKGVWAKAQSPYLITGNIVIPADETLTIEPGVEILSEHYYDQFTVYGTLIARGTATDSIRFTGRANPGYSASSTHGGTIIFQTNSSASELAYVSVDHWGDKDYFGDVGALQLYSSGVNITHSSFRYAENWGIRIGSNLTPQISNNNFINTPVAIAGGPGAFHQVSNNSNAFLLILNEPLQQSATMRKPGTSSRYTLNGGFTVTPGNTLTIEPGVEIRSTRYYEIIRIAGTLIAKGTVADSIRFTGIADPDYAQYSTHGGALKFDNTSQGSEIAYMAMDRWGDVDYLGDYGAITIYPGSVSVKNSHIRNSEGCGIYLSSQFDPVIQNNRFSNNKFAIKGSPAAMGGLSGNEQAVVSLINDQVDHNATLAKPGTGSWYILNGGFRVSEGQTLTIQPGVEIRSMFPYDLLSVNGTLIARGTAADSIRFTGFANPEYSAGATHGGRIEFQVGSKQSVLEYVAMDRWGDADHGGDRGAVVIGSNEVTIQKSNIRNSERTAIGVENSATPVIADNKFANNPVSILSSVNSVSRFGSNRDAAIGLRNDRVDASLTIHKAGQNSYYILNSGFIIPEGVTLTLDPGVVIHSNFLYDIIQVYGTLIAKGTATDSIYFKGFPNFEYSSYSSHGGRISFEPNSSGTLEYVVMDGWGDKDHYNQGSITLGTSSLSIRRSFIRNSEGAGLQSIYSNINPSISDNKFGNNNPDIISYVTGTGGILNNTGATVQLFGDRIDANTTWPFPGPGSHYLLTSPARVEETFTLTVEAGSAVDFGEQGNMLVNGNLRAIGTEAAPIRFYREIPPQNYFQGGSIYLTERSSNSVLEYVSLDKCGTSYGIPAFTIYNSRAQLSNITISNAPLVGLMYSGTGEQTLRKFVLRNNETGLHVSSGRPVLEDCQIYANASYGILNVSSNTNDTVDARNCYWGSVSGPQHPMLNPAGSGNAVSNKVKFQPWRNQPPNAVLNDIGVTTIIRPVSDCKLSAAAEIEVRVENFGNVPQSVFQLSYRINNGNVYTETFSGKELPAGDTLTYIFNRKADLSVTGDYIIKSWVTLANDFDRKNDTAQQTIRHIASIPAPASLIPLTGAKELDIPVAMTWQQSTAKAVYNLYVWSDGQSVPTEPLETGTGLLGYSLYQPQAVYGAAYQWKVVARQGQCLTESPVQTFSIRHLPDLVIDSISVPPFVVSETEMDIRWITKNKGLGGTQQQPWYEDVYLCDQPVLYAGAENYYIGSYRNLGALAAGESYTSEKQTYRIPRGLQGKYYVVVIPNANQYMRETNTDNNRRSQALDIVLTPPPDLQVTQMAVNPLTVFSEDEVSVSYTVRNEGKGPVTVFDWTDQIYISSQETPDPTRDTLLHTAYHNGALQPGETYNKEIKLKLPSKIHGTFYIHIHTDRFQQVFEYDKEDNNSGTSQPLTVIHRPTPDLVVHQPARVPDTVSAGQTFNVQWTTANEGAVDVTGAWTDDIYLCPSTTFNQNTAIRIGSHSRYDSTRSLGSSSTQASCIAPTGLSDGKYYVFIKTDAYDQINEIPGEDNNLSPASAAIVLVSPDLLPLELNAPATAATETNITISWKVQNKGRASIQNNYWTDNIFLSSTGVPGGQEILLNTTNLQISLGADGEYYRQAVVSIPAGISGNRFLVLMADAFQTLREKDETNNRLAVPITVSLSPWADLRVKSVEGKSTDTAGTTYAFSFTVANEGAGNINSGNWTDRIYLTRADNTNEAQFIYLGDQQQQQRSLAKGGSYTVESEVLLPSSLATGDYRLVIVTNSGGSVFENTDNNNNTFRGQVIHLLNLPPVDLSVTGGQLVSTQVVAGQPLTVSWTVRNNSNIATVISSWKDAIYLSSNAVLDANDKLLAAVPVSAVIEAGASRTQQFTVQIPQDAEGTLYLLVTTDLDNQHKDPQRGNNTLPLNNSSGGQGVEVIVPPPSDLQPHSFSAPTNVKAGQPIRITVNVRNEGTGPTNARGWVDQLYITSAASPGSQIIQLASFIRSGALQPGAEYKVSEEVIIPYYLSGNYLLYFKSDANNQVYEKNGENNNEISTPLIVATQQPCDLQVSRIDLPAGSVYAGDTVQLKWQLRNIGVNNASGDVSEAVYLSKDTVASADDILAGVLRNTIVLPSLASAERRLEAPLQDLAAGEYYVIVKTDILNTILESDETNNQTVSIARLLITVKELKRDIVQKDTLSDGRSLYYRIEIPQSLNGEVMSIRLTGNAAKHAVNRLYVRYQQSPDANVYDHAGLVPFQADQEVIIPDLKQGTWYLKVMGEDTSQARQPVELLAKIIPFSVTSVDAKEGGNTGLVTVKINGARFSRATQFFLENAEGRIPSQKIYYTDQSSVYVTFNLKDKTTGVYDVLAVNDGTNIAKLSGGFTIRKGPAPAPGTGTGGGPGGGGDFVCQITNVGYEELLETGMVTPAGVRLNSVAIVTVYFENKGTVDIPVQTRILLALRDNTPLGFNLAELTENKRQVLLECKEKDGPPGILRPGAKGFIKVLTKATVRGTTSIDLLITE